MSSEENGETQDQELLERYRRASGSDPSAPSDSVRAAILAESRRVAQKVQTQAAQPSFDTARPAANDSRWKFAAFGSVGAALLAALIIAPRYWGSLPSSKKAISTPVAQAETAGAPSDALQAIDVTSAKRRELDAQPAAAAKSEAAPLKDLRVRAAPATPLAAPAIPSAAPGVRTNAIVPYDTAQKAPLESLLSADRSVSENGILAGNFVERGAPVNARDADGRTPLMLAVGRGQLEVVRQLLQRGADPNLADKAGKTPLQLATEQNLTDIAALLRAAGAR